jgi:hypothetical protein
MLDIALIGVTLYLMKCGKKAAMRLMDFPLTKVPSEHQEQAGFVQWFRAKWPRVLIFAIPNGGKRNISTARNLKLEGVVPGVPDLFIPAWSIWIEMKRQKGGRLSPDQEDVIAYLEASGHRVIVGYGATDASDKLLALLKMGGAAVKGG